MVTEAKSINSAEVELRLALESAEIGVLPATPKWVRIPVAEYPAQFGLEQTLESQRIISRTRRDELGDVVSATANAGFTVYFTPELISYLAPGIFLATPYKMPEHGGELNDDTIAVTVDGYDIGTPAGAAGYVENHLVFAEFFGTGANNGLKVVEGTTSDVVDIVGGLTAEASPPAAAIVRVVGYAFPAADVEIVHGAGELPELESATITMSTLGLRVGQWIYIGSGPNGAAGTKFVGVQNGGFARIAAITGQRLIFDRTSGTPAAPDTEMTAEAGTGLTIRIYFANQAKDERLDAALFARNTFYQERTLGVANPVSAPTEIQTEDVIGTVFSQTVITINRQSSVKVAITAIGINGAEHLGSVGDPNTSDGDTIVDLPRSGFFAAGSQVKLLRVGPAPSRVSGDAATDPLFRFASQFTITLTTGAVVNVAVGSETGFDVNIGTYRVVIEFTNYFVDVQSKRTIRQNDVCTFHCAWARQQNERQVGVLLDLPSGSLSGGAAEVVIDQSVTQPLILTSGNDENVDAGFSINNFWWLPNI